MVVGFSTLVKIPLWRPVDPSSHDHYPVPPKYIKYVMIPFFLVLFICFSGMHLVMINAFFYDEVEAYAKSHPDWYFPQINRTAMAFAMIALLIHHGVSYFVHFIGKKEYLKFRMDQMIMIPYKRLVLTHVVVLIFGLVLNAFGITSAWMVSIFFLTKMWIDYQRHRAEHASDPQWTFKWY